MTINYSGLIALVLLIVALIVFLNKYPEHEEEEEEVEAVETKQEAVTKLDLNDEDATVASLIAAIECRNETHKNVQVISVRKVG